MEDRQKVYIKGSPSRGNEVIKLLEDLGGSNTLDLHGNRSNGYYYINPEGMIDVTSIVGDIARIFIREFYKEIKLPKWKPECDGEEYFYISDTGRVLQEPWQGTRIDNWHYNFGNCFRTLEEAEVASNKIKEVLNQ